MKHLPWSYFTAVFFGVYVFLVFLGEHDAAWFLKPFLIPFLSTKLLFIPYFSNKKWLVFALTFSWIGDVMLMFKNIDSFYFIVGLFSFLLAHLFYIYLFAKLKSFSKMTLKSWLLLTFSMVYLICFLIFLFSNGTMEGMYFPVSIYAFVLSLMLWSAGCLFFVKPHSGYDWILIGALSFVASDSLLAINKFCHSLEIQDLSFYIIATYLFAQFAIFNGIIYVHRHKFM